MDGINLALFTPASTWAPPKTFPNLSGVKQISIDLETNDPNLEAKGPGNIRKDGFPVGISVAADGYNGYFPFAHLGGGNLDQINVCRYFRDLLKRDDLEIVTANGIYDLGWLEFLDIQVHGQIRDIQIAEPLMDEEAFSYALDVLGKKYLGVGKDVALMKEACTAYSIDQKTEMWKLPSQYVGPYAEADTARTLAIYRKQLPLIESQGLKKIFDLESALTPILLKMRNHGVRIDLAKASKISGDLRIKESALRMDLKSIAGCDLDIWSPDAIARVCDDRNITYARTPKGNPTFGKVFLKNADHPLFKAILACRNVNRLRTTYVDDLIRKFCINGRIHCEFHQIRGDEDGTRTGRFSSSCPNLQQIPARDPVISPLIRSMFIPEEGEEWNKLDYSQQEPRILTHFGAFMKFRGADVVLAEYQRDKTADFYQLVANTAKLKRKPAKDLTLGRCYGEGKDKMARDLGVSVEEAEHVLTTFDEANPFIKELQEHVSKIAEKRGYIKTILGRHQHFGFWEPFNWKENTFKESLRLEEAEKRWPGKRLRRAFLYKGLNKLIQGSAADMTKAAMLLVYREMKRIPLLQVHDELDYSLPKGGIEGEGIKYRMENCVDMLTPILAELEQGPHWK